MHALWSYLPFITHPSIHFAHIPRYKLPMAIHSGRAVSKTLKDERDLNCCKWIGLQCVINVHCSTTYRHHGLRLVNKLLNCLYMLLEFSAIRFKLFIALQY